MNLLETTKLVKSYDGRAVEESATLKVIFSWLAFGKRPISLREVNALMLLKFGEKVLDIEDEIAGKCSR